MAHEFYKQWSGRVDSSNCAREPIHLPGAVQPHGVLVGCDENRTVVTVSENCHEAFGVGHESLIGRSIGEWIAEWPEGRQTHAIELNGAPWLGRTHVNDQQVQLLELYPAPDRTLSMEASRQAVGRLRATHNAEELLEAVVEVVHGLLGCDRVMLYRFDDDDHGEIMVERVSPGLEVRFLGQHFPEADIPVQARRLYTRQLCRSIPEIRYDYVPMHPPLLPSGERLDMSLADLRSVSPVHCDYMSNMGVTGTFTLSIVLEDRLWGLIACHHSERLPVDLHTRDVLEFIAEVFTWELESLLKRERAEASAESIETIAAVTRPLMRAEDLWTAVTDVLPELSRLFDATGAALVTEETVRGYGRCPTDKGIFRIMEALEHADGSTIASHHLSKDVPRYSDPSKVSGVLACQFDSEAPHVVLFFRDEHPQSRVYGSPLNKAVVVKNGDPRLSPSGSFELYSEQIEGQSERWTERERGAIGMLCDRLTEAQAHHTLMLQRTNHELRAASEAKDQFLAALSHELRNPLNAMVGWSTLLTQGRVPQDRVSEAYRAVHRNALAQQRLIDDLLDVSRIANGKVELRTELLELETVVQNAIDVTTSQFERKNIRVQKSFSPCGLVEADAERLTQVVWNLLTNAAKFTPNDGHVAVRVFPAGSWACVEVQDDGIGVSPDQIPLLFRRFHQAGQLGGSQGLGLGLSIVHGLTDLHGGDVVVESDGVGKGTTFRVRLPVALRAAGPTPMPAIERFRPDLDGIHAVVVDDQVDAVSLLRTLLLDGGATVDVFTRPDEALAFLETSEADLNLIVSDVNMVPFDGYEFARRVRQLPRYTLTPMLALTAYAGPQHRVRAFRAGFSAHMAKPIDTDEFVAMVASVTGRF